MNYSQEIQKNIKSKIDHICNWIKDYFITNGPDSKAVIGISGGKDSTVAATLLVEALGAERVIGVLMPEGRQKDIEDAREICQILGIKTYEINIHFICESLYNAVNKKGVYISSQIETNAPARIRMNILYTIAAAVGGRVANTSNWSEIYIGYTTKYGDMAGDFAILSSYTATEVVQMGLFLAEKYSIPTALIGKIPNDGMSGKSDEENLGFSYNALDNYLLNDYIPPYEIYKKIKLRHERSKHKRDCIRIPAP